MPVLSLRAGLHAAALLETVNITEKELQGRMGTQNFKYYRLTSDSQFLDKHLKLKLFGVLPLIDIIVSLKSLMNETRMSIAANMPNGISLMVEFLPCMFVQSYNGNKVSFAGQYILWLVYILPHFSSQFLCFQGSYFRQFCSSSL